MSIHTDRQAAEFKRVLSETIRDCVKDPRLSQLCSVTKVEITKDQKHAKVFVSVFDNDDARREGSIAVLQNASSFIAKEMNSRIRMRRIPMLHFVLDSSIEYSVHISKLLKELGDDKDGAEQEVSE